MTQVIRAALVVSSPRAILGAIDHFGSRQGDLHLGADTALINHTSLLKKIERGSRLVFFRKLRYRQEINFS